MHFQEVLQSPSSFPENPHASKKVLGLPSRAHLKSGWQMRGCIRPFRASRGFCEASGRHFEGLIRFEGSRFFEGLEVGLEVRLI